MPCNHDPLSGSGKPAGGIDQTPSLGEPHCSSPCDSTCIWPARRPPPKLPYHLTTYTFHPICHPFSPVNLEPHTALETLCTPSALVNSCRQCSAVRDYFAGEEHHPATKSQSRTVFATIHRLVTNGFVPEILLLRPCMWKCTSGYPCPGLLTIVFAAI